MVWHLSRLAEAGFRWASTKISTNEGTTVASPIAKATDATVTLDKLISNRDFPFPTGATHFTC
jgi:hypothetical protein